MNRYNKPDKDETIYREICTKDSNINKAAYGNVGSMVMAMDSFGFTITNARVQLPPPTVGKLFRLTHICSGTD